MKSLNEKLAAALLAISDKEDLVKQHTKVTEEAVAEKGKDCTVSVLAPGV
ncbi:hypothetical protein TRIUR3_20090 [Triticum urartu]|uniref:Uncharacterized protein n=1 Tax=Triticum urartu TaxID=4572 RepID=M7YY39_TRIUA|nr:hypothetical protein TRIUR3_20090 [Triticum urartu]